MASQDGHLDPEPGERKGWFIKDKPNPLTPYRAQCTDGYRGPPGKGYDQAHHVLPKVTIDDSTAQHADPAMLRAVQWITNWNLNNSGNMIGLPTFSAYFRYFHDKDIRYKALKKLMSWANVSFPMVDLLPAVFAGQMSPEGHVIHNPVSWGHTEYNEVVTMDLVDVWKSLSKNSKDHPEVAGNFAGLLNSLQQKYKSKLIARGANANRAAWERRGLDANWHVPFTMWNVQVNPLF